MESSWIAILLAFLPKGPSSKKELHFELFLGTHKIYQQCMQHNTRIIMWFGPSIELIHDHNLRRRKSTWYNKNRILNNSEDPFTCVWIPLSRYFRYPIFHHLTTFAHLKVVNLLLSRHSKLKPSLANMMFVVFLPWWHHPSQTTSKHHPLLGMAYIADDIITIHIVVSPYFRGGPRHTPNIYSGLTLILNNVFYYFPNQATTCSPKPS